MGRGKSARARIEAVARTLESYARRGVFRGFSQEPVRGGKAAFRMTWHRDRAFEFLFDVPRNTMRFPLVLPNVTDPKMDRDLREFVRSRHSAALAEHRRIDRRKAQVRCYNRGGDVSLTLRIANGNDEYGARKLVHLVHEIYMSFLIDGGDRKSVV